MRRLPKTKWSLVGIIVGLMLAAVLLHSAASGRAAQTNHNETGMVYLPAVMNSLPPVIPDTTKVLTGATTQHLVSVSSDGSTFTFSQNTPELSALNVGDVMVSDVTDAAPYGFLRRVTDIVLSGGQVVIATIPATLEDAIQQGTAHFARRLTPADLEALTTRPGVTLRSKAGPTIDDSFYFELNDVVLYDEDGNYQTTDDQIKANGSVELAPDIVFDWNIQYWSLRELVFIFNAEETAELELETEVEVAEIEAEYEIAHLNLGVITVFVGPVPVVYVLEMPIYVGVDGDVSVGVSTSVTQQANLSAGLRYEQGDWTPISSLTNNFTWQPPTLSTEVELKGYVEPLLSLLLYGIAGPTASANPFLELEADLFANPWWELFAGIEATVGVKVEVMGHSFGDHTEVVIGYRVLLASAPTPTPTHTATSTPTPMGGPTVTTTNTPTPTNTQPPTPSPTPTHTPTPTTLPTFTPTATATTASITSRVSVASDGTQGNDDSSHTSISADGRYVAFSSQATNLVANDTNGSADIFVHDRQTGETIRVSVSSTGVEGNDHSGAPAISADGRYIAFDSTASNLVDDDTNECGPVHCSDIFVRDRQTGTTTRVSVASNGTQGDGWSAEPSLSADGRYIAFFSYASNLVANDTNGYRDVFVHDTVTGATSRVSVASGGSQGDYDSYSPAISADGRYVAFVSDSTNLVSGDTNTCVNYPNPGQCPDVFVHDRQTGETARVSISSDGTQGNDASSWQSHSSISADGRYVAFQSYATNLVANDSNGWGDIFVHDRQTGETTLVSVSSIGGQGDGNSQGTALSADGRYIAFISYATNLVQNDTNLCGNYNCPDIFVHDRQTGETSRVSIAYDDTQGNGASWMYGTQSLSADGLYVTFASGSSNLVIGDTNGDGDVFVHERE
jgi:Tol biopolymer transport system component